MPLFVFAEFKKVVDKKSLVGVTQGVQELALPVHLAVYPLSFVLESTICLLTVHHRLGDWPLELPKAVELSVVEISSVLASVWVNVVAVAVDSVTVPLASIFDLVAVFILAKQLDAGSVPHLLILIFFSLQLLRSRFCSLFDYLYLLKIRNLVVGCGVSPFQLAIVDQAFAHLDAFKFAFVNLGEICIHF